MCLIIDNSKRDDFFKHPLGEKEEVILGWIRAKGRIAVGGKLRRELIGSQKMKRLLVQLKLAGRLKEVDDAAVDLKEEEVKAQLVLESDDPHVIALALISGARLLHTADAELINDFKNVSVIPTPRGKIFNGQNDMLRRHGFCSLCRAA